MAPDKLKIWLGQLSFPVAFFGMAMLRAYIEIYVFENYEHKHGQWNSFKISLMIYGVFAALTTGSFLVGQLLFWNEFQELSRLRHVAVAIVTALLTLGVMGLADTFATGRGLEFLLWLVCIVLCPAVCGILLAKLFHPRLDGHQVADR